MLITELGYRAPGLAEVISALKTWKPRITSAFAAWRVPSTVLHGRPLVSYSGITPKAPLGVASLIGMRMPGRAVWFLLSPTWSIEEEAVALNLRQHAVRHRLSHPRHNIVFMCNTNKEARLMRSLGEAAVTHNKTVNTNENVFRPVEGVNVEFDAIYNAQLAPWKRHELAVGIPTCGFLFYRGINSTTESEAALITHHLAAAPSHVFINRIDEAGVPVRLTEGEVNVQLNRASVGLCLSAEEGAMFACAEYLLAGLPVVTTENRGGRDFFVDKEFCITVQDNPREVAAGVAALKARDIPRSVIRDRTMQRISAERAKFTNLVNSVYRASGIDADFQGFQPRQRPVIMLWHKASRARRRAIRGKVDKAILS